MQQCVAGASQSASAKEAAKAICRASKTFAKAGNLFSEGKFLECLLEDSSRSLSVTLYSEGKASGYRVKKIQMKTKKEENKYS